MATDSLFVLRPNAVKLSMATRDYLGNLERKQLRSRTSSNAFVPRPSSLPPGRRARVPPEPGMVARIQRRPRLYGVCLALLVGLGLLMYSLADVIVLARFKLRDRAYEEGWINGCGMRKRPLLFIRDNESLAIVWETNCAQDFELSYGPVEVPGRKRWTSEDDLVSWAPAKVKKIELEGGRFVYQAVLQDLRRGRHAYKVTESASVLARHTFSWIGSSSAESTTIHFAALSDNQFNLRTFHRLLLSLLSYAKSLPSSPLPSFLLHAGDQVQNPHNLQQWQTDFYEPLTSLLPLPLGQTTPILLARGNHDWDVNGVNAYTGGTPPRLDWLQHMSRKPRVHHPGTFYSYSPHQRVRFLVLDSNLVEEEDQLEQEEWLLWELERPEWTEASLRVVVVHVPPFLEFWDRTAWTAGKENQWSLYVRHRLTPLLSQHGATLVLSGHSHAYSRGFLPTNLHRAYTTSPNSSSLPPLALAVASERSWEKARRTQDLEGTVYAVFGGAGGSFDVDRVEQWGFYERSITEQHHFVWIKLVLGQVATTDGREGRTYRMARRGECGEDERAVEDELEWSAIGQRRQVLDRFRIVVPSCIAIETR